MNKIESKIENWLTGVQMVQMFSFGGPLILHALNSTRSNLSAHQISGF